MLIYLTGDQGEEEESAERWTNQPTKRAPGGRAGCPPNNHRWTKRTKVSEAPSSYLTEQPENEPNNW